MNGRSLSLRSLQRCGFSPNRSPFKRLSSDLSRLKAEMTSRRTPPIRDYLTPTPSALLQTTLGDFLPGMKAPSTSPYLPHGYHLIHFPSKTPLSALLPDGTEPMQSPGEPFTRRMWAGGSFAIRQAMKVDSSAYHCQERIIDVQSRGQGKDEKIFVEIDRKIFPGAYPGERKKRGKRTAMQLNETRTLVFMRHDRQRLSADGVPSHPKLLLPTEAPDFFHTLVPTAALLFRFSALTFNAHAIHLDKHYCHDIEGHRNLLVHGPLTLVLMLQFLNGHLRRSVATEGSREEIFSVEYRNLAPLYAEEEMKICAKQKEKGTLSNSWDVWVEGKDGGYAVKGVVRTRIGSRSFRPSNSQTFVNNGFSEVTGKSPIDNMAPEKNSASMDEISTGDETISDNKATSTENSASESEVRSEGDADEEDTPFFQR